jgi:hypothetical protein
MTASLSQALEMARTGGSRPDGRTGETSDPAAREQP